MSGELYGRLMKKLMLSDANLINLRMTESFEKNPEEIGFINPSEPSILFLAIYVPWLQKQPDLENNLWTTGIK